LRVPTAYGLAYLTRSELYPTGRPESVFISLLVSWTLGALITFLVFRRGAWRERMLSVGKARAAEE
jgi:Na+-driven multidrug efflux pump